MKKYLIFIYFIFLLVILNINIDHDTPYDQSRHMIQGYVVYKYYDNLLHGNFMTFDKFTIEYNSKAIIGYQTYIDPPFHAMLLGFVFLLFGPKIIVARLLTQGFFILGLWYFYRMCMRVFIKRQNISLIATIILSLIPMIFQLSRQVMLTVPAMTITIIWFYYMFFEKKHVIITGLLLTAMTLLKYQNIIFISVFMFTYIIVSAIKGKGKEWIINIIQNYTIQCVIVFVISLRWVWLSLLKRGFVMKLFWVGTTEGKEKTIEWTMYFFTQYFLETFGLVILIIFAYKAFTGRYHYMLSYILVTLLFATVLLSNRQLRYIVGIIPFSVILIVFGLVVLCKNIKVFYAVTGSIIVFLLCFNIVSINIMSEAYGKINTEAFDYVGSIYGPKQLVGIEAGYNTHDMLGGPWQIATVALGRSISDKYFDTTYNHWPKFDTYDEYNEFFKKKNDLYNAAHLARYIPNKEQHSYSPDNFLYNAILLEKHIDPKIMSIYAVALPNQELVVNFLNETDKQINTYVFVSNMGHIKEETDIIHEMLINMNYTKKEFTYYDVYGKWWPNV